MRATSAPTSRARTFRPLVSVKWLRRSSGEPDEAIEKLELLVRRFIADAQGHLCECADVSLPGDPAFIDATLRVLAGDKN